MKLRYTLMFEQEVKNLEHYEAETLEQAARNQQAWIQDESVDPYDILGITESLVWTVSAVHEDDE